MKKSKKKDYSDDRYKVEEFIETLSESSSGWGKRIVRGYMDDNPATIDIRYMKVDEDGYRPGKGIALNDDECNKVVDTLVSRGYGDDDVLSKELDRRQRMYGRTKKGVYRLNLYES